MLFQGVRPGHCRIFSKIPGPYPLPTHSSDNQNVLNIVKCPLGENHRWARSTGLAYRGQPLRR